MFLFKVQLIRVAKQPASDTFESNRGTYTELYIITNGIDMWIWITRRCTELLERHTNFTRCYSRETNLLCPLAEINKNVGKLLV
jgi:hypothetical protein